MNSDRPRPRPQPRKAPVDKAAPVALSTAEERRRWLRFRRPREPFYKDARVLRGRVRVDVSVRMLLIALVLFAATVAGGAVYVINQGQKTDRTVASNHKLAIQVQDAQKAGHASRLEAQAETKREVSQLACFFWNFIHQSKDPGFQVIAHELDRKYSCVVVTPKSKSSTKSGKPSPSPEPSASIPNAVDLPSTGASSSSGTSRSLTSRTPPAPSPAPAAPPPTTPSPANPPLGPLGPVLCALLHVAC